MDFNNSDQSISFLLGKIVVCSSTLKFIMEANGGLRPTAAKFFDHNAFGCHLVFEIHFGDLAISDQSKSNLCQPTNFWAVPQLHWNFKISLKLCAYSP